MEITFKAQTKEPMLLGGNIDEAFEEFFKAKNKQMRQQADSVREAEKAGEPWPMIPPEIGEGKDNAFKASNGISIWFE